MRPELLGQGLQVPVAVRPVARPPGPEHPAGRQRNGSAEPGHVLPDSLRVPVAVAEEVPVLPSIGGRARLHPARIRREAKPGAVVEDRPPGPGDEAGLEAGLAPPSVQGAAGSAQVPAVDQPRRPVTGRLPDEVDAQVSGVERSAIGQVTKAEVLGLDHRDSPVPADLEGRHLGAPVGKGIRRPIVEGAVRSPLQTQQPGGEDADAGGADPHLGLGRRHRVAGKADAVPEAQSGGAKIVGFAQSRLGHPASVVTPRHPQERDPGKGPRKGQCRCFKGVAGGIRAERRGAAVPRELSVLEALWAGSLRAVSAHSAPSGSEIATVSAETTLIHGFGPGVGRLVHQRPDRPAR